MTRELTCVCILTPAHFTLSAGTTLRSRQLLSPCRPGHGTYAALATVLPNLTLTFAGGQRLLLLPQAYLYAPQLPQAPKHPVFCTTVLSNGPSGAIIGGAMLRDVLVTYDNAPGHESIHFRSLPSCADYASGVLSANGNRTISALPLDPAGVCSLLCSLLPFFPSCTHTRASRGRACMAWCAADSRKAAASSHLQRCILLSQ